MTPQEDGTFLACPFTKGLPVCLYRLWAQKFSRSCGPTWRAAWGCRWRRQKEARRGWDVAALRRGAQGIHPQHAALLGVFCRYVADQSRPCTCPQS